MIKRLFDILSSLVALIVFAPVLGIAAIGIRLSSPGPILYRAQRMGIYQTVFMMYKFRTMNVDHDSFKSAITAKHDPRIFRLGAYLRRLKVDELPQLFNVLKGEMSIVGPRPEDPKIVLKHYSAEHLETLSVRPGLASPGSIFNYTHGEALVEGNDPEQAYLERLLPLKLALELIYVQKVSFLYDLKIIFRTIVVITGTMLGRNDFPDPPELERARSLVYPCRE